MHSLTFAVTSMLAAIAAAAPNYELPTCKRYTDNFDNIAGAITGRVQVGTYNGVTYQAWNAAAKSPVTGSTGGVIPHSDGQDIVVGVGNDALQLGSLTLNPFGNIVAAPSRSFDLYSFWFGCGSNLQQPAASIAIGCVLSVTGFDTKGRQLPVVTYSYAPTNPLASPMVLAELPSAYRGLANVTLGLAAGTGLPATSAIWVDDVSHCNYSY